jgi:hypothetical protein
MFYLANRAPEGTHYPYYSLLLTHPGVEVTGVVPGEGGEARDTTWINFPLPDASDSAGTKWYINNLPEPVPPDHIGPIPDWSKNPDKVPDQPYIPQPIDFKVDGVELTQAIQCFDTSEGDKNCPDNSLLLAAGKLTVARVYISRVGPQSADPQYPKVRVDLSIVNSGNIGSGAYTAAGLISQQFVMPLKWDRKDAKTTANFLIPAPMAGKLYATARVNVDNKWPDPNPNNNESAVTSAQVVNTLPVNIGWTRMRYKPAPPSTKYPNNPYKGKELADEWWVANAAAPIKWLFPTAKVNYFKFGTGITDYYFELNKDGKLAKHTPDVRDDFVWYSKTYGVTTVFLKARLISLYSPSLTNLFAWFPKDAFYKHSLKGLAEGAPPVYQYGKGRVALSQQPRTHLLPHEVGHNFGLGHYPCFLNALGTDHQWPAPYNKADCNTIEVPFNPVKTDKSNMKSFMTYNYSAENAISPPEWTYLINKLKTASTSSTAQKQVLQATPNLLISGWLNSVGQGELNPIYRLQDTPGLLEPSKATTAEILFLDSDGRPIGGHAFEPQFGDPYDASADFGTFQLQLPPPDGLDRVQLLYNGSLVAERQPSAHAPEVELLSPPPGSELDGLVSITWQASDLDDDALTYTLFYSHDGGTTWLPLGVNLTDPVYELDTQQVPGGEACFVKVLVSDGWHTGKAVGGPFSVARKPPAVTIDTPRAGMWKRPEQAVVLVGSAYDAEQGPLPDEVLAWRSDRDGLLGHGATLVLPGLTLERGEHVITLSAVDGDGQKGVERVRIVIGHGLYLPIISKPSP